MATFAVVGPGGVGGLLGALLARGGHDVRVVARGEALRAIASRGLQVQGPQGLLTTPPLRASEDPGALGTVDFVLVALKTWQVEEVAPRLLPLLAPHTLVVPLQNGVEAAARLARVLGEDAVAGGLCHMLSRIEAPGVIHWWGGPPSVTVGERRPGQRARLEALVGALQGAGALAQVSEDAEAALWAKLLFVAAFGAVGAWADAPAGVTRARADTRAMLVSAMREVEALARARGVRLPADVVDAAMARVDGLTPDATASLQRDLKAGRPSELEDWVGAVVRLGREAGVPTPTFTRLYTDLTAA